MNASSSPHLPTIVLSCLLDAGKPGSRRHIPVWSETQPGLEAD